MIVCLAHYGWNAIQRNKVESEVAKLTKVEKEMKSMQDGMKKKQDERDKLNQEVSSSAQLDASKVPQLFDALRRRPMELLKALAQNRTEGLVIDEIVAGTDEIAVRGEVLHANEANRLRSALEGQLAGLSWQVLSPSKSDLGYFANGGPWQFEIELKDLGLLGFVKNPSTPAKQP